MIDRSGSYRYESVNGLKASNLPEYLMQGGREEKTIRELADNLLNYLRERRDCADFRAAYLMRVLYAFENDIPRDVYDEILKELLAFPYEDCGGHSMCTWTENHRLYAAGIEFLLTQKHPEAEFLDGKSNAYHREHSLKSLKTGLGHIVEFGFCEWGSNNYYSETMAGLSNLVQFSRNDTVTSLSRRALYMLVYDVLSQTVYNNGYIYNPACARAYVDNKISQTHGNYLEAQLRAMFGEKADTFKEKEACFIQLLYAKDNEGKPLFPIPESFLSLVKKGPKETCLRQGIDIDDYKKYGLSKYTQENVRYAMIAGAISEHRAICHTMRYLKETGMIDNGMLKNIKPYAHPLLYRTGLLKHIKKLFPMGYDGVCMEEGRIYTYTDRNWSLSAAFDYRVGDILYQQNSLSVNLSHDISLFATLPFLGCDKTGSPCYWIGSAMAGRAAAYRNFAAIIFNPGKNRFGIKKTHLFFPTGLFDRTDLSKLSEGLILACTGGVNVCVHTDPGVYFIPKETSLKEDISLYQDKKVPAGSYDFEYDLVNETGGYHHYAFYVDNRMEFEEFCSFMREREFIFDQRKGVLSFDLNGIRLPYSGEFTVNGSEFRPEFKRLSEIFKEECDAL